MNTINKINNTNKMNKKGMGIEQAFVSIIVVLTFGLIMIFGYKAIDSFLHSGEDVGYVQFKSEIESDVKRIFTEYGSVREKTYRLPAKYEQICLVNMNTVPGIDENGINENVALCQKNILACSVWEDAQLTSSDSASVAGAGLGGVEQNVFLTPDAPVIKVKSISIADLDENGDFVKESGYLCMKIRAGKFTLRLEGKGDHTQISKGSME
ncbi:hypothetical protein HYU21_02015 [Candidatus Woesearchaeota archaeon]|nr:hypothetical protein [Candidatus Woesearchaeota archaeon]